MQRVRFIRLPSAFPTAARLATLGGVLALLGACASHPTPVHVVGSPSELTILAGTWEGEYGSAETGRSGSISFTLKAGTDTAFGDVVMVPRALAPSPNDARSAIPSFPTTPQVLPIAFVRIASHEVSGTLDPYKSPDCGCTLSTLFRGTIKGDRMEGTFTTTHSDHTAPQQKGTWWAKRKADALPKP